jgi:hypothetical protein
MSGTMPDVSKAQKVPVRPMPVCASSMISSMPRLWQCSWRRLRYPSGRTKTPPELRTGSTMQQASEPEVCASIIDQP